MIYVKVELKTDTLIAHEQTGFQYGRSIVDQVAFLSQETEDKFLAKKMADAGFVHLTAAADDTAASQIQNYCDWSQTVHMINHFIDLIRNLSFTLTNGTGPKRRLRRLRKNFSHGSVLAPRLFNIYT